MQERTCFLLPATEDMSSLATEDMSSLATEAMSFLQERICLLLRPYSLFLFGISMVSGPFWFIVNVVQLFLLTIEGWLRVNLVPDNFQSVITLREMFLIQHCGHTS